LVFGVNIPDSGLNLYSVSDDQLRPLVSVVTDLIASGIFDVVP
jgi:hypothetical protein